MACAAMATLMGTFTAAGGSLTGADRMSIPRPEREELRKSFFKKPKADMDADPLARATAAPDAVDI